MLLAWLQANTAVILQQLEHAANDNWRVCYMLQRLYSYWHRSHIQQCKNATAGLRLTVWTPQLFLVKGPNVAVNVYVVSVHTVTSFPAGLFCDTDRDVPVKMGRGAIWSLSTAQLP